MFCVLSLTRVVCTYLPTCPQFTGSLYSEIEPEIASAVAALDSTQALCDLCDGVAKGLRDALAAAKIIDRDVRESDRKRDAEIRKIAKDEADCESKALSYWAVSFLSSVGTAVSVLLTCVCP